MGNTEDIRQLYEQLKASGPYGTLAPHNRGGLKSQYIATVFDEAILPYFRNASDERVLDFGCAGGILSNKLAHLTRLTVGVDITPGMLQLAKKSATDDGRQASYLLINGKRLPFKDGQFDSVVTRETLFYICNEDFPDIFAEINRILCRGGRFYIIEQVSESPRWQTVDNQLIRRRSFSEFTKQANSNGFECIDAHVVRQPRFPWIYLFWLGLLPKRLMRPLAKLEIGFNKRFVRPGARRYYHNVLFIMKKVG